MKSAKSGQILITGLGILTPLGDEPGIVMEALWAGKSAVGAWRTVDSSRIYSKIGADLGDYDPAPKLARLKAALPPAMSARVTQLTRRLPWSAKISVACALDAYVNAGGAAAPFAPDRLGVVVASSDVNLNADLAAYREFLDEPDFTDPLYAVHSLDTNHAGAVAEALEARGEVLVVAGACASGNLALKHAVDQIRYHDLDAVVVVGPVYDFASLYLQSLALAGAISTASFNDTPAAASRPFDARREGFVPAHAAAAIVVESAASAKRRGAKPRAEIVAVAANSDANHLPVPDPAGQVALLTKLFAGAGVRPEEVDFVSAHATSTVAGDIVEMEALARFFGAHAARLKINAPKSLLGHPCGSAAVVETVLAVLQIEAAMLHGTINVERQDPRIELDVLAGGPIRHPVRYALKNSFGFGGMNSSSLLKAYEG